MYDITEEMKVYVASLPFMEAAKAQAASLQMNDHGPLHAQRVHSVANQLACLFELSIREKALLLAAALLHDIGMSRDRDNHNKVSRKLVLDLATQGELPFDEHEAQVVATLCEWHRGDYDSHARCEELQIRTGLLSTLLRVADAMDLDYRRSDDFSMREPVISRFYPQQAPHHVSVRNIVASRLYITRLATRLELFVNEFEGASLQIGRLIEELSKTPIAWPVQVVPMRSDLDSPMAVHGTPARKAIIFSYCNTHGAVQSAISKRHLHACGFETKVVCDFERTGHPSHFWENVFPTWDFEDVDLVVLLDLHMPEYLLNEILNVVRANRHCRWVSSIPLERSRQEIRQLIAAGVDIVLADERVLFFGNAFDETSLFWIKVAALCNYDDPLVSTSGLGRFEYEVARGLRYSLWNLINSRAPAQSYAELIDRIATGNEEFFGAEEPKWSALIQGALPDCEKRGRVLVLDEIGLPGRFVYDVAYRAIEMQGLLPHQNNEFVTPFAICTRKSRRGVDVLFLSRFTNPERAYPVKYFVPQCKTQLGNCATIWQAYPDNNSALQVIDETVARINKHCK